MITVHIEENAVLGIYTDDDEEIGKEAMLYINGGCEIVTIEPIPLDVSIEINENLA